MIFPVEYIPWVMAAIFAVVFDQMFNHGKITNSVFGMGNTYMKFSCISGIRLNGQYIEDVQRLGFVTKTDVNGLRFNFLRYGLVSGNSIIAVNEDEVFVPLRALQQWRTEPVDLLMREDIVGKLTAEKQRAEYDAAAAKAKANFAMTNSMDLLCKVSASVGEVRRNLGVSQFVPGVRTPGGVRVGMPMGESMGEGGE